MDYYSNLHTLKLQPLLAFFFTVLYIVMAYLTLTSTWLQYKCVFFLDKVELSCYMAGC